MTNTPIALSTAAMRANFTLRRIRCATASTILRLSAALLRLSHSIAAPAPTVISEMTINPPPCTPPEHAQPLLTVQELLDTADRSSKPVFALRIPRFLIQVTKLNETLEAAVEKAFDEGDPQPRPTPFFASRENAISELLTHIQSALIPPGKL
jgi:hypothetical protein